MYTVHVMTKDRIFTAAKALFDRDGLAGLSIRKIARDVGLTPMAIYRHFADKDAIIDALMLDGFSVWEERVRTIAAEEPLRWLEQAMETFLDFALTEPRRYEAAFLLPARKARRYPHDFQAGRSPAVNMVYARLEQAAAQGAVFTASASQIVLNLSALAQGLVAMHQAGRFTSEPEFRAAYRAAISHCFASFIRKEKP